MPAARLRARCSILAGAPHRRRRGHVARAPIAGLAHLSGCGRSAAFHADAGSGLWALTEAPVALTPARSRANAAHAVPAAVAMFACRSRAAETSGGRRLNHRVWLGTKARQLAPSAIVEGSRI